MADSVIELSLCLSDIDKNFIVPGKAHPEKKYLYNVVVSERQQPDQYGQTHTVYINYKASDGKWYKSYIGSGKVKTFGQPTPPPPSPSAPQAPQRPAPAPKAPVAPAPATENEGEDLPFN